MEIQLTLPQTTGPIIEQYLKVLSTNTPYTAYTLDDDLNVITCNGIIENNKRYNYHNNYDNSELELFIIKANGKKINRWFSLNKNEVIQQQLLNINNWRARLEKELTRLQTISLQHQFNNSSN